MRRVGARPDEDPVPYPLAPGPAERRRAAAQPAEHRGPGPAGPSTCCRSGCRRPSSRSRACGPGATSSARARRQPFPGAWLLRHGWHPVIEMYHTPPAKAAFREMLRRPTTISRSSSRSPGELAADPEGGGIRSSTTLTMSRPRSWPNRRRQSVASLPARARGLACSTAADAEVERAVVRGADIVWACSAVDAAGSQQPLHATRPDHRGAERRRRRGLRRDPRAAGAPGARRADPPRLYRHAQLSAERGCGADPRARDLPALRAAGRAGRTCLVGRNPTEAIRRAAAGDPDVTVTGDRALDPALARRALPDADADPARQRHPAEDPRSLRRRRGGDRTAKGAEGIEGTTGATFGSPRRVEDFIAAIRALWHDEAARRAQAGQRTAWSRPAIAGTRPPAPSTPRSRRERDRRHGRAAVAASRGRGRPADAAAELPDHRRGEERHHLLRRLSGAASGVFIPKLKEPNYFALAGTEALGRRDRRPRR